MSGFAAAAAHGTEGPEALLERCLDALDPPARANLGFVYVSDHLAAALPAIIAALVRETGIRDWVGTIGLGVCTSGREHYDVPAISLLVGALPERSYLMLPTLSRPLTGFEERARRWLAANQPPFGVVHGDPANGAIPAILDSLAEASGAFLVGGLTASRVGSRQVAGGMTEGGVSGVLIGPEVAVATGLSQGCLPLGRAHTITEGVDNVVMALDDRPALDVLIEDAGEGSERDPVRAARFLHPAFPVPGSDTRDYLVRNLTGVDRARGWIEVGEEVEPGMRMMFCKRDPESARADLEAMLEGLRGRIKGPPKAGIYVSCVGRGPFMFGPEEGELAAIRRVLGGFPLAGFYANGEISHNRLYGYTGVLTLFL
ncbi:MAG: FIST C-terminal domain-containing protein [Proteobacteria bacterium]|nr:FIST C-terminal domain-containing protein [Pseudomonadota bacterium]